MTIVNIAIYPALPSISNLKGHGMETTACHAHLMSCPQKILDKIHDTNQARIFGAKNLAHFCRLQLRQKFTKNSQVIYDYSCKANTKVVHIFSPIWASYC